MLDDDNHDLDTDADACMSAHVQEVALERYCLTCLPYTSVQKSLQRNVITARSFSNTALVRRRHRMRENQ